MSGRFVFPAEGGVLNPKHLHKNPSKPGHLQESQRSADWFRVYLKLKPLRHDDDKIKPEPADIWYCGSESEASKRPVFEKVKNSSPPAPGWYALVPREGKYWVDVHSTAPFPVEVRVKIDGKSDDRMLLNPNTNSAIMDVQLIETKAERDAKEFDASKAGTIVVEFRRVKDVKPVRERYVPKGDRRAGELIVNEQQKNNMVFQALSVVPEFVPDELFDYEYELPHAPVYKDTALPNGSITIRYRTDYWMMSTKWIAPTFMTMDMTADDDEVQVTMHKAPPPRPTKQSRLVKYLSSRNPPLNAGSKIREFFDALGGFDKQHPWGENAIKLIIDGLRKDFVDTVKQLKELEEEEWGKYLSHFAPAERQRSWLLIQEAIVWIVEGRHFVSLV